MGNETKTKNVEQPKKAKPVVEKVEEVKVKRVEKVEEVKVEKVESNSVEARVVELTVTKDVVYAEPEDLLITEPEPKEEEAVQHTLKPQSSASHGAGRNVATASSTSNKVVNKPKVFNPGGVPSTVKSVVESERTGFFRIHRDKGINN